MSSNIMNVPIRNPHRHDVLCGRGGGINAHEGNKIFRNWVQEYKEEYNVASSKIDKTRISQEIISRVKALNPPGRFLCKDASSDSGKDSTFWYEINDQKAMSKTSQALREGAPALRALASVSVGSSVGKRTDAASTRKVPSRNKRKLTDDINLYQKIYDNPSKRILRYRENQPEKISSQRVDKDSRVDKIHPKIVSLSNGRRGKQLILFPTDYKNTQLEATSFEDGESNMGTSHFRKDIMMERNEQNYLADLVNPHPKFTVAEYNTPSLISTSQDPVMANSGNNAHQRSVLPRHDMKPTTTHVVSPRQFLFPIPSKYNRTNSLALSEISTDDFDATEEFQNPFDNEDEMTEITPITSVIGDPNSSLLSKFLSSVKVEPSSCDQTKTFALKIQSMHLLERQRSVSLSSSQLSCSIDPNHSLHRMPNNATPSLGPMTECSAVNNCNSQSVSIGSLISDLSDISEKSEASTTGVVEEVKYVWNAVQPDLHSSVDNIFLPNVLVDYSSQTAENGSTQRDLSLFS